MEIELERETCVSAQCGDVDPASVFDFSTQ